MKLNTITCALAIAAIVSMTANASTPNTIDPQGTINGVTFVGVDINGNMTDAHTFVVAGTSADSDSNATKFNTHAEMLNAIAQLQTTNPTVRVGWVNGQEQVIAARAAFKHDPTVAASIVANDNLPGKFALVGKNAGYDQVNTNPAEHAATAAPVYVQTLVETGALTKEQA